MKLGFLIDNRKCIGCHACTVACKQEHDVPLGRFRTWVKYIEKGEFPDTRRHFSVMRCNHCERPPCVDICPVTALFKRDNGIVDFDPEVCIGCKSCMQACPYDALFIDPDTGAANKCNFCAHRIDIGREPPCVTVCPEQAIVMGDLDDPGSVIRKIMAGEPTSVRAPEKGTRPQLRYVEGDPASLNPLAAPPRAEYMWSQSSVPPIPLEVAETTATRTYDVGHERPWGSRVTAYLVTKALASGCFVIPGALWLLDRTHRNPVTLGVGAALALFFLAVTTVLLIADLKRPKMFLSIITRPQWKSWLVKGAFVLMGYGAVLSAALAALWWSTQASAATASSALAPMLAGVPPVLLDGLVAAGLPLGAMTAMYTAWLFRQCEARDLWRSPWLPWHLLTQALIAGAAFLSLLPLDVTTAAACKLTLGVALLIDLLALIPHETGLTTATRKRLTPGAREAAALITRGLYRKTFWGGIVLGGHLMPLLLLWFTPLGSVASLLALAGLVMYEHVFIEAGQAIPLS
ncbi:MAG: 4Fe-4S dicluster domain-containing protein [Proteobacteria bacterium]|nr:4Fe-4S dicluster domain-containing protein [Pseudomonadota bacterium]